MVAGDFQGSTTGLEVAVAVDDGGGSQSFIDVVPISSSGVWGNGVIYYAGADSGPTPTPGNIVAADLNGAGKPSITLSNYAGQVVVLLADPDSNQFLPVEYVNTGSSGPIGMLAVEPFMSHVANPSYRGPTSDPSTLVLNSAAGTWTRTYPDGTAIQFNSSGQETSENDRNGNTIHYAYVSTGPAAGALASITDPVGLITTLAYNSSGISARVKDPASRLRPLPWTRTAI